MDRKLRTYFSVCEYLTTENIHKARRGFSLIELLIVMAVAAVLFAMTLPVFTSIMRNLRADGDMRSLAGDVTLAKMRAAASFSKSRVRIDTSARTFQLELWNKATSTWSVEGGVQSLSPRISYGYGSLGTPPPYTQSTINQAPACQTNAQTAANTTGDVANTGCIVFSSRGIPVDATGIPTAAGAIYVTDGNAVQAGNRAGFRAHTHMAHARKRGQLDETLESRG